MANASKPVKVAGKLRYVFDLIKQPVWIFGTLFLILTFVFGILALDFGQIAAVQPIVVVELLFTLALRRVWLKDRINKRAWSAASMLSVGLAGFLLIAHPQPGSRVVPIHSWILALSITIVIITILLAIGRKGSPARRAALIGSAGAVVWSIDAGFVKSTTEVLARHGWSGVLEDWPLYALIATGLLGEFLVQVALHVGPLSASQPAMLIVEPFAGICVGILLFGEKIAHSPLDILGATGSLIVMLMGVVLISRWSPPPITPRFATVSGNSPVG